MFEKRKQVKRHKVEELTANDIDRQIIQMLLIGLPEIDVQECVFRLLRTFAGDEK